MLLFHKERIFRNNSKLVEQESISVNCITENSPKELDSKLYMIYRLLFITRAERDVQVQMEDGLGEAQLR